MKEVSESELPEPIARLLQAFRNKQLDEIMTLFAEDAIIYDPSFPTPLLEGKVNIRKGLSWTLGHMEKPGFTLIKCWKKNNGTMLVLDTHHLFHSGKKLEFQQVFFAQIRKGLISEIRAYVPYRPPAVGGLKARFTGFFWRLRHL